MCRSSPNAVQAALGVIVCVLFHFGVDLPAGGVKRVQAIFCQEQASV